MPVTAAVAIPESIDDREYELEITATDASGVDADSIDASSVQVRRPDDTVVTATITKATTGGTTVFKLRFTTDVVGVYTVWAMPNKIEDTEGNSIDTAEQLGTITTIAAPQARVDLDFTGSTALPATWASSGNGLTVTPSATGLLLDNPGSGNDWGTRYVTSPAINTTQDASITFIHGGGNNAVGIHSNPALWDEQDPDQRGLFFTANNGRFKWGRTDRGTAVTPAIVNNDVVKLDFEVTDNDVKITVSVNGTERGTYTEVGAVPAMTTPTLFADAAFSDVRITAASFVPAG